MTGSGKAGIVADIVQIVILVGQHQHRHGGSILHMPAPRKRRIGHEIAVQVEAIVAMLLNFAQKNIGMTRVLTAAVPGWDASVRTLSERLAVLRQDTEHAAHAAESLGVTPVEVVPGGGVRAVNAPDFLTVSPHLHASCRRDGSISAEELAAIRGVLEGG
jgi:hypothetical protein